MIAAILYASYLVTQISQTSYSETLAAAKVHRSARGAVCSVLIDLVFSDPANWRRMDGQPGLRPEVASNIRRWAEDDILDRGNHPSNLLPLAYLAHLERDFEHCGRMIRFALEASADTGKSCATMNWAP